VAPLLMAIPGDTRVFEWRTHVLAARSPCITASSIRTTPRTTRTSRSSGWCFEPGLPPPRWRLRTRWHDLRPRPIHDSWTRS